MRQLLPLRHPWSAVLFAGLAAAHAHARAEAPTRAVMQPAPGVEVSYERLGAEAGEGPLGRFDGSFATPAGTLRTTVRVVAAGGQPLQLGETSLELPMPVLGGQLQLRELETGGTAAVWRTQWNGDLAVETQCETTPVRSGQSLQLQQPFGEGHLARALLSRSSAAGSQGLQWDVEVSQVSGPARWNVGVAAAERSYVSAFGATEARVGVRLGAQWELFPGAQVDARYTRQVLWDAADPVSWVMLGTRIELPRRLSLVTALETDTHDFHKASLTLSLPLQPL